MIIKRFDRNYEEYRPGVDIAKVIDGVEDLVSLGNDDQQQGQERHPIQYHLPPLPMVCRLRHALIIRQMRYSLR
jgi:hypothetical protein